MPPEKQSSCEFQGSLTTEARTRIARALTGAGADLRTLERTGRSAYRLTFTLPEEAAREDHLRAVVEVQEALDDLGHACKLWEPPAEEPLP